MLAPGCEFVATSLHSTDGGDHAAICELMPGEVCGDDAESLACVERMNQSSYLTVTPSTLNLKEGYYRLTNETAQVSVSACVYACISVWVSVYLCGWASVPFLISLHHWLDLAPDLRPLTPTPIDYHVGSQMSRTGATRCLQRGRGPRSGFV